MKLEGSCRDNSFAFRTISITYCKMWLCRWRIVLLFWCLFLAFIFIYDSLKSAEKKYAVARIRENIQNSGDEHSNQSTIVTAYFDLGTFGKGSINNKFTKQMYFKWAEVFKYMKNPLVVYTDAVDFYDLMTYLRHGQERFTKIFLIQRNSSWAFQNEPRIKDIISSPGYPRHHPNTVISGYSCAQHAKYDVIERVARSDYFKTKFIAWVDIGYFRNRHSKRYFELVKLTNFDESRVIMNQVYNVSMNKQPKEIFLRNRSWVGGGLFMGERNKIIQFAGAFRKAVEFYLSEGLVNTDQQVLYAMYSMSGRKDIGPNVDLQLYWGPDWFGLGNKMIKEES